MEGDFQLCNSPSCSGVFQSTPSAWRETFFHLVRFVNYRISIHSLRMEGDLVPHPSIFCRCHFNPLPPHGGRPSQNPRSVLDSYFNPLPPHGGRHRYDSAVYKRELISIHSLRMEGDTPFAFASSSDARISIHSLRMEGDLHNVGCVDIIAISIHSLRMEGD